ncbi:hypothetical protein Syn7803C76_52 [Synechococcus phage ACG-2014b]|uniref:PD-(D/E)XK nuclease domain-containing protein n=2 Tax=Synechococcus phage ACG-2014b TaxID=1493508 RepID=A0A0E3F013_9CAUD|nr:hypothetical protein ABF04_gp053 [Synechococcus phage ACG-2014b]YP_009779681.1 hypothetical protein HOQ67_gp053 [Synechococcus phage ACG-2014b]AIX17275.1 hypothetical protein Syn7803C61_53 [Synechococcus phage ACG-2014b]AIX17921.1 hypothetical protein Syn7803C68_53 [Synechococcus phage ACG-2014b]AIX18137.1 hypothetical protein Syn7803C69_53 [Synechococcus phage ACG-2014b]AIX19292.1 hypothetical protein Syn7803C76_52 [Synechococcus phage ACG-2014b]AIX19727.1 hypothetical protein Syn7803C78_
MATHASRRTDKTGKDFENLCEYILCLSGVNVEEQVNIGLRPTGGAHNVDLIVDEEVIISLKYQDVAGTAEEKIPYEQMCLQHACETYGYKKAVVVLAGPGWTHDDSYRENVFGQWMNTPDVSIINFDEFLDEFQLWETFLSEVL